MLLRDQKKVTNHIKRQELTRLAKCSHVEPIREQGARFLPQCGLHANFRTCVNEAE